MMPLNDCFAGFKLNCGVHKLQVIIESTRHNNNIRSNHIFFLGASRKLIKFPLQLSAPPPYPTVWKFQEFSITQILREIRFWDFRSAKSAIFTHLEGLNFDFALFEG